MGFLVWLKSIRQQVAVGLGVTAIAAILVLSTMLGLQTQKTTKAVARGDVLQAWQDDLVDLVTTATVEPDAKGVIKRLQPSDVKMALGSVIKERDRQRVVLRTITLTTQQERVRAAQREADLTVQQNILRRQMTEKNSVITDLRKQRSTGTDKGDVDSMANAADAAWNGWVKK